MKPCWKRWRRRSVRSPLLTPLDGSVIAAMRLRFSTYEHRCQFVPGQGEVTSETAFLTVSGDMAYGVFIERWRGRFKGRPEPTELMIRATLIFRREDGEWKAVHRHGDNAVEKVSPS